MKNISVCIATFNGARFILPQLRSILEQLQMNDEVIISDDSSTDNTLELIRSLQDPRIRIFEGQQFYSPLLNFEHALKQATKDLIFLSDQDDLWVAGRVKAMSLALEGADMVVCDHSVINEDGEIIMQSYFECVPSKAGIIRNLVKNTYYGCCMAFRKSVLEKALPFPKDVACHDVWLGLVAGIYFKSEFIEFPFTLYRKHQGNASTGTEIKSENSLLKKAKFRFDLLKHVPALLVRNL